MSDLMTRVRMPVNDGGLARYGKNSRSEMISTYKSKAKRDKERAEAILAMPDDEFIVEQYRGVHVHRNLVTIPPE